MAELVFSIHKQNGRVGQAKRSSWTNKTVNLVKQNVRVGLKVFNSRIDELV